MYPTLLKHVQKNLNENLLKDCYSYFEECLIIINCKFVIELFNQNANQYFFQLSGKSLQCGKNLLHYFDASFKPCFSKLSQLNNNDGIFNFEHYTHNNGQEMWYEFVVKRLQDNEMQNHLIIIAKDVTQQRITEKNLLKQKQCLSAIAQLQSHQVRQPLCNILSLVQIIKLRRACSHEELEHLHCAAMQLDKIIKTIVTTAREM